MSAINGDWSGSFILAHRFDLEVSAVRTVLGLDLVVRYVKITKSRGLNITCKYPERSWDGHSSKNYFVTYQDERFDAPHLYVGISSVGSHFLVQKVQFHYVIFLKMFLVYLLCSLVQASLNDFLSIGI